MTTEKKNNRWTLILIITAVFAIASIGFLLVGILSRKAAEPEPTEPPVPTEAPSYAIMDSYETMITEDLTNAYAAANAVKKVFWIDDDAQLAPMPNES